MDRDDAYLQKAEEARKLADLSPSELHRDRWLRLARGWLDLVRRRPRATDQEERPSGLRLEPLDLATLFPQLYGLAINELLGTPFGFFLVVAKDNLSTFDVAIRTDDVGIVSGHRAFSRERRGGAAGVTRDSGGEIAYFFNR
jgi:hypothetical protein